MHAESIGGYSPFSTEWILRGRDFGEGVLEVTAVRADRYVGAQGMILLPRAKRGESENTETNLLDAAKRAKQQVRLRCKAIGADRMITLTYRENVQDKSTLKKHFDALRRRLRKLQKFAYVAVAERQTRGAWHLHVAVKGRLNYRVLGAIWRSVVGESGGYVRVTNPFRQKGLRHKLAAYLSKYITKDFEAHDLNEKRYWTSRGIEIPEAESIAHIGNDPFKALVMAFDAALAAGATLDRCQSYWNQELGCFWLATREHA